MEDATGRRIRLTYPPPSPANRPAVCAFGYLQIPNGTRGKLSYHASYPCNTQCFLAPSLPAAVRQTLSDNAKSARQNPRKIQKISSEKIIKLTTKNIPTQARREDCRARYVAHSGRLSVVATWKMRSAAHTPHTDPPSSPANRPAVCAFGYLQIPNGTRGNKKAADRYPRLFFKKSAIPIRTEPEPARARCCCMRDTRRQRPSQNPEWPCRSSSRTRSR